MLLQEFKKILGVTKLKLSRVKTDRGIHYGVDLPIDSEELVTTPGVYRIITADKTDLKKPTVVYFLDNTFWLSNNETFDTSDVIDA